MPARSPVAQPEAVAAYLDAAAEPARSRLRALAEVVREEAPQAAERMAYGLPTWHQGENLVHLGAFKEHVGIYPGAAAIVAFEAELGAFKCSKGAIQVPHDLPLPTELLRRIVRWRLEQVAGGAKRAAAADYPRIEVASREALRGWLEAHHATARGAWLVTWKKQAGERHVSAAAVAEEALCVGWVDSLPRALDGERSMLLVTPRKPASGWSAVNKARVEALRAAGQMRPAGLAAVAAAKASGSWAALDAVEALALPAELTAAFDAALPEARTNFDAFPRSAKRAILEWIQQAKRAETRSARIAETVAKATRNERANQWRPNR